MPHLIRQKQFRTWPKPGFCYLCGEQLQNGATLNDDHCPPLGMFALPDRQNYPLILRVHAACNHSWHAEDEKFSIMYDVLHGVTDTLKGKRSLSFLDVVNEQGRYLGIKDLPLIPLVFRIVRCAHALLYGEWLPVKTSNTIHIPVPEVDAGNANKPKMHQAVMYSFADTLCTAQKTNTHDSIVAYNGRFRYVCTWSNLDSAAPICIFTMDIYKLNRIGISIKDFPQAVIGSYLCMRPASATKCSLLKIDNSDADILYPILIRSE